MKTIEIKGYKRSDYGKKGTKAVRREAKVPCVAYGNGDPVHFSIDETELRHIIYTPNSYIIDINLDGKIETLVMREVQYHPVKDNVLHIDFYRVSKEKPFAIDIPIKLIGVSEGVKQGGKMMLSKRSLRVVGKAADLPDTLDINVASLELGKSIFVSDVDIKGLTILTPASTAICAVRMTRAARGAAATGEK